AKLTGAVGGRVEGYRLAVNALGLFRRLRDRVDGAQHLGAPLGDDLSFLLRDQRAELLDARRQEIGSPSENLPALVARELRHRPRAALGRLERPPAIRVLGPPPRAPVA